MNARRPFYLRLEDLRIIALFCLLAATAWSQDFRATVLGQVFDPSGGAVPAATVRVTNVQTNQASEVQTSSNGLYTISYLNPGEYTLEVTASGFKAFKRTNLVLQTADKREVTVRLEVGDLSTAVTISSEVETIETATAARGLNFDPVRTQHFPLNGRQTYQLLSLAPGVYFTQEAFGAGGHSGTRGWDVTNGYRINGGRAGTSQFLLNGAPISDKDGNWQLAPNVEAVQEFKVMTNTYDAQYGRFTGGVVNTTLKSGTNEWHGSAFEFMRNSVLDSNTSQNTAQGKPRTQHNQHQFGGVIGGPIRKDKDWALFSFEGWREIVPFNSLSSTVPMDMRDGKNFSKYGYSIYDPQTTRACNASIDGKCDGVFIRQMFPNNEIPSSRISPIGKRILDYYPTPNQDGRTNNFVGSNNKGRYRYDQPMGRVDHVINENNRIYGLFTYQHGWEYRNSTGFPRPTTSGDIFSQRTQQSYIVDWTSVVNPTMVFDLRMSYGRFTSMFPRTEEFEMGPKDLGMDKMPYAPSVSRYLLPQINVDDYTRLFDNTIDWNTDNQWNLAPSLAITKGRHSLHVGAEFMYTARGSANTGTANGNFTFARSTTRKFSDRDLGTVNGITDGSSVASMLLGLPGSGGVEYRDTFYRTRPYYAFYIQDDWKVRHNLTLNIGLRYDIQVPMLERYNRINGGFTSTTKNPYSDAIIANWKQLKSEYDAANPNAKYKYPDAPEALYGGLLFAGVNGQPKRSYDTDWTNIAPRFGAAWQFAPKTVMRGGFGLFYRSPTQDNTTTGFTQTTGYVSSLDGLTPSAGTNFTGPYSLYDPFPTGLLPVAGSSLGLMTNVGNGISFDGRKIPMPRTYQYSFGFEHEFPWKLIGELSYTGNIATKTTYSYQMGNPSYQSYTQATGDPSYLDRNLPNPFKGVLPASAGGAATSNTVRAYDLLRSFPMFRGVTNNTLPKGRYRYDGLQARLEKRLSSAAGGALTFVGSYTWSKTFEENHRLNDWNINEPLIHEIDYQDKPHNFAFSGVWDLPLGTGKRFLNVNSGPAKLLVNNWRFTWMYTKFSGYPTNWPDLINSCGVWQAKDQNRKSWFNNDKSCYKTRPSYTFRVNPDRFSDIRNPTVATTNLSVEKTFTVTERYKLHLRGEGFNVTNSVHWKGPNTSLSSELFGQIPTDQQNFPRHVQLALKLVF